MEPRPVVFVAPFFAETTVRFILAAARLPGVRLGLLSQDPPERLPREAACEIAAHLQLRDALDPGTLRRGVEELARRIGPAERLIGALEQLQVPLAEVREQLGIPGAAVREATNFRDKSRMKDVLRAAGVPCARHGLARNAAEALAAARQVGFPLVIKPPAGAGAQGTFRVEDPADLERHLGRLPFGGEPILLEEFIVGEEHSFDTVSIHGQPVWHSLTDYNPGPLTVMENPWIQWTVLLPREIDDPRYDPVRQVAFRALDALGIGTGLTHMEWFERADGSLAVSEVAARPPGAQFTTLISYAHDLDLYRAWARLMIYDQFDPPERRYAAGIAFLRGQGKGRVKAVHGLEEAQREVGSLVAEVRLPQPGQPQAAGYEGEGYVILRHPETAVVREALARLVRHIRVELG